MTPMTTPHVVGAVAFAAGLIMQNLTVSNGLLKTIADLNGWNALVECGHV